MPRAAPGIPQPTSDAAAERRRTALVIDDSVEFRAIARAFLAQRGIDVIGAGDGAEGVRLAQRHVPDVILVDLMLPIANGFEVCSVLHADPRTRHIPILMITGVANPANVVEAKRRGARRVLQKPISGSVLTGCIERVLTVGATA